VWGAVSGGGGIVRGVEGKRWEEERGHGLGEDCSVWWWLRGGGDKLPSFSQSFIVYLNTVC
jgi:hypothetical protein